MLSSDKKSDWRILSLVVTAVLRTVAMLFLLHAAVFATFDLLPEATYSRLGSAAIERRTLEETRKQLGLNGTVIERYVHSLTNLLRGDLGRSIQSDYPVFTLLMDRLRVSAPIILASLAIAAAVMVSAARWYCTPVLSHLQRVLLAISPAAMVPQFASASTFAVGGTLIIGASGISGATEGIMSDALLFLSVAIMPAGILFMAAAQSAQESVRRRFVLTYLSMGFPWARICRLLQTNILRAMLPLCNRVALAVATGTVFAELSFNRPGIGAALAEAIRTGDQPLASGWMVFVAAPVILVSQLATLLARRFPAA